MKKGGDRMNESKAPDIQCPLPQAGAHGDFERCIGETCAWFDWKRKKCAIISIVEELKMLNILLDSISSILENRSA
jgi:hypothetical protein